MRTNVAPQQAQTHLATFYSHKMAYETDKQLWQEASNQFHSPVDPPPKQTGTNRAQQIVRERSEQGTEQTLDGLRRQSEGGSKTGEFGIMLLKWLVQWRYEEQLCADEIFKIDEQLGDNW